NYTLYACWTPKTYTVTLNPNGGSCSTATKKVTYGQTYGTLPVPTRSGYVFAGWWTAKTGGKQVTATTTCYATGNYTLYARWWQN
ncbi:MAG: InlB B-repeat-containing protein, partial [Clostridia bacterium]|nr:InlB B-repeat-containing protein [Clostridia bacterium]